jgi:hypothetical protein
VRVSFVSCDIGKRVRFNDQDDLDLLMVLFEDLIHWVNILRLVLLDTCGTVTLGIVVTSHVRIISAANFTVR